MNHSPITRRQRRQRWRRWQRRRRRLDFHILVRERMRKSTATEMANNRGAQRCNFARICPHRGKETRAREVVVT